MLTFQQILESPHFRGISVGKCVEGPTLKFPIAKGELEGHAHFHRDDPWRGWICVADPSWVLRKNKRPTSLLVHEFCHLVSHTQWHNDRWRKAMNDVGEPIPVQYQRKV